MQRRAFEVAVSAIGEPLNNAECSIERIISHQIIRLLRFVLAIGRLLCSLFLLLVLLVALLSLLLLLLSLVLILAVLLIRLR